MIPDNYYKKEYLTTIGIGDNAFLSRLEQDSIVEYFLEIDGYNYPIPKKVFQEVITNSNRQINNYIRYSYLTEDYKTKIVDIPIE